MSFTLTATVERPYADTVDLVRAALAEQGFGVLTEIDLARTLADKLGVEVHQHSPWGRASGTRLGRPVAGCRSAACSGAARSFGSSASWDPNATTSLR